MTYEEMADEAFWIADSIEGAMFRADTVAAAWSVWKDVTRWLVLMVRMAAYKVRHPDSPEPPEPSDAEQRAELLRAVANAEFAAQERQAALARQGITAGWHELKPALDATSAVLDARERLADWDRTHA